MNNLEIIKAMIDGEKITYVGWDDTHYIRLSSAGICMDENDCTHDLNIIFRNNPSHEASIFKPKQEIASFARFRFYDIGAGCWFEPTKLYRTLDEFKQERWKETCLHHHEIEGTRVDLPITRKLSSVK